MGNSNNIRIILGSLRYKSAPNTNLFLQVPFLQTQKELDEYDRTSNVQLEQVFDDERQRSDTFRPTCKFSFLFKNKYSGTTNYVPFENNLYYINAEVAAAAQCQFGSTTTWSGYPQFNEFEFIRNDYNVSGYTIPSGNTNPPIVHINFVAKSASSYNWNFYMSYPFDNVDRRLQAIDQDNFLFSWSATTGIPFKVQNRTSNGRPLVSLICPIKHNLSVGEYVKLSFTYNNNSIFQVYSLGNDFFNSEEYIINLINVGFTGTTFNNGAFGTLRRIINDTNSADTISKYYVRRHKILTNPEDAIMTKAGFEQNIFGTKRKFESSGLTPNNIARVSTLEGSQSYTLSFSNEIKINDLLDNQKRPLTELFFTVLWKGYFGWTLGKFFNNYRPLKQGYEFNIPNTGTPTNWWSISTSDSNTNFTYSDYSNGGYTFSYVNPLKSGDIMDGAFCEWNDYEQNERVISNLVHKITYNPFVFNLNDDDTVLNPKGYYYEPHHKLTIRVFSEYIDENEPQNNSEVPNYAYFSTSDNVFKWRDIYEYGYIDTNGLGINYPFLNGVHYPYANYIFRMIPEGNSFVELTITDEPTVDPCE